MPVRCQKGNQMKRTIRPDSTFKKGDMVIVKNSENKMPKPVKSISWSTDFEEWTYRLPSDIAPFFSHELVRA